MCACALHAYHLPHTCTIPLGHRQVHSLDPAAGDVISPEAFGHLCLIHGISPPPDWGEETPATDEAGGDGAQGVGAGAGAAPKKPVRLRGLFARAMKIQEQLKRQNSSGVADYDATSVVAGDASSDESAAEDEDGREDVFDGAGDVASDPGGSRSRQRFMAEHGGAGSAGTRSLLSPTRSKRRSHASDRDGGASATDGAGAGDTPARPPVSPLARTRSPSPSRLARSASGEADGHGSSPLARPSGKSRMGRLLAGASSGGMVGGEAADPAPPAADSTDDSGQQVLGGAES